MNKNTLRLQLGGCPDLVQLFVPLSCSDRGFYLIKYNLRKQTSQIYVCFRCVYMRQEEDRILDATCHSPFLEPSQAGNPDNRQIGVMEPCNDAGF